MSFIGNSSTNQTFVPQVDYFSGNASNTAFTLSRAVGSAYDIQAVIENVPQNPSSAFTVSGNIITFTSAPPSGSNNIYVRYTSPATTLVKPAPGTVSPTEINSSYSLWNLSGADINYTAGNVGVGTTSPADNFYISRSTNSAGGISVVNTNNAQASQIAQLYLQGGDNAYAQVKLQANSLSSSIRGNGDGSLVFLGGTTERMRIDNSGNVGVGTTSPTGKLHINQTGGVAAISQTYAVANFQNSYVGGGDAMITLTGSNQGIIAALNSSQGAVPMTFYTGQTERMRIDNSGNAWFRSTGSVEPYNATSGNFAKIGDSNYPITAASNTLVGILNRHTSTGVILEFKYNGTAYGSVSTNGSSVAFNTSSDYRLKENIAPMTGALNTVAQLKPVTYNWKSTGETSQGFIAHELQSVVPDCVTGEKDGVDKDGNPDYQGVDSSFLVATLTAAIQEQQAIITQLTERIEVLEAK